MPEREPGPLRGAGAIQGSPLSFLGVVFQDTVVTCVRIVSGRAPLGAGVKDLSDGGRDDLVVMDDFLYWGKWRVAPDAERTERKRV
jgi:hypothetical protein